jgi:hypothetical protein
LAERAEHLLAREVEQKLSSATIEPLDRPARPADGTGLRQCSSTQVSKIATLAEILLRRPSLSRADRRRGG